MFTAAFAMALFVTQAAPVPPTDATLRRRLDAYEAAARTGKAEVAELAGIASAVLEHVAGSADTTAAVQACASSWAPPALDCSTRLWAIAKRTSIPLYDRASAAAVLARRNDKDAAAYLAQLVKGQPPAALASFAIVLDVLPPEVVVPAFRRMLASEDAAAQVAACRALGLMRAPEALSAANAYLAETPRGTAPWYACTLAAAKLGDPAARQMVRFRTVYMRGDDLVAAADLLVDEDVEGAIRLYMSVTREGRGIAPLEAAERLISHRPDIAQEAVREALKSADPMVRAAALEVHRKLKLEPEADIRALLFDASGLVRVRAAEVIAAWAADRARR